MPVNIISYPPGGGGNHLRNLAGLDDKFHDQWPWAWTRDQYVGLRPYDVPLGIPGEVHALPGRNIHEVFIDHIEQYPQGHYILQGHFGELAPYAERIRRFSGTRWMLITMDQHQDRVLLRSRQNRLHYHPYWLDEEQIFLYRAEMYRLYFGADLCNIHTVSISQFWDLDITPTLDRLELAFDVHVDRQQADVLHTKWMRLNHGK